MISAVLLEGDSFEEADSIATAEFPVLPRVGEWITLPIGQRFVVLAINHHQVQLKSRMEIFILVKHHQEPKKFDMSALLG